MYFLTFSGFVRTDRFFPSNRPRQLYCTLYLNLVSPAVRLLDRFVYREFARAAAAQHTAGSSRLEQTASPQPGENKANDPCTPLQGLSFVIGTRFQFDHHLKKGRRRSILGPLRAGNTETDCQFHFLCVAKRTNPTSNRANSKWATCHRPRRRHRRRLRPRRVRSPTTRRRARVQCRQVAAASGASWTAPPASS